MSQYKTKLGFKKYRRQLWIKSKEPHLLRFYIFVGRLRGKANTAVNITKLAVMRLPKVLKLKLK